MDTTHNNQSEEFHLDSSDLRVKFQDKTYPVKDVLDAYIYAEGNVPMFSKMSTALAGGKPDATLTKGAFLGKINTWVIRDGLVWWEFDNGKWAKHTTANMSINTDTTYSAKVKAAEEARKNFWDKLGEARDAVVEGTADAVKGAGKSLSFIGENLGTILIIVAIIAALFIYFKYIKQ